MAKSKEPSSGWGGRREGAGRPKTSPFVAHVERPSLKKRLPMKVMLRLRTGFPTLRSPEAHKVFEKAASRARRFGIRIIEYSLLPNSIHMVCEAKKGEELERSFKSLNTTLAIALKKFYKTKSGTAHQGPVFLGRYHLTLLESPEEMKAALKDVLTKPAQHFKTSFNRDPYSSAVLFEKWKQLLEKEYRPEIQRVSDELEESRRIATVITASPQFWLTKTGWQKATLT